MIISRIFLNIVAMSIVTNIYTEIKLLTWIKNITYVRIPE